MALNNPMKNRFDVMVRRLLNMTLIEPSEPMEVPVEYKTASTSMMNDGDSNTRVQSKLLNVVNKYISSKIELAESYEEISNYHITKKIVRNLVRDIFYKGIDGEVKYPYRIHVVSTRSEDKDINDSYTDIYQAIHDEYRIDSIISDALPELFLFGEYLVLIDKDHEQIDDDIPQELWKSVYLRGKLDKIVASKDLLVDLESKKDDIVIFDTGVSKRSLKVPDESGYYYRIRVTESLFDEAFINLVNTIKMMESLIPTSELENIKSKNIIYLRVPPTADVKSAFKLARQYESLISMGSAMDSSSNMSSVLEDSIKFRVIPIFGDKGTIEYQDLPKTESIDSEKIDFLKRQLADLVPIDPRYLGLEITDKKQEIAYLTLLQTFRIQIAKFVEVLLNKIRPLMDEAYEIKVEPINIVSLDEIQKYDMVDIMSLVTTGLGDAIAKFTDTVKDCRDYLDAQVYAQAINKMMYTLTDGQDLVKVPEVTDEQSEDEYRDEGPSDTGPSYDELASRQGVDEEPPPSPEEPSGPSEEPSTTSTDTSISDEELPPRDL